MRLPIRWRSPLAYLVAFLLIFILPLTWHSFDLQARYFSIGIFLLGGVIWFVWRFRFQKPLATPKIILPIILFVVLEILLLYVTSLPSYAYYWISMGLLSICGFLFVQDALQVGWLEDLWQNALLAVGFFLALFDLLILLGWQWLWSDISGSLFSTPPVTVRAPGYFLGHPNFLAGYINLVIPLCILRLWRATNPIRRIVWLGVLLCLLAALYFSYSRGGWLALAGALGIMSLLKCAPYLRHWLPDRMARRRIPRLSLWLSILLVGILGVGLLGLVRNSTNVMHGSLGDRLAVWQYALDLIRASPIWGFGPSSVPFLYAMRAQGIGADEVFHSHNLLLQIATSFGLIGVLILIWLVWLFLRAYWGALTNSDVDMRKRDVLITYTAIFMGVAVHGIVDFLFWHPVFIFGVLVVLALFIHHARRGEYFQLKKHLQMAIHGAMLITCLGMALISLRGSSLYRQGLKAARMGDWFQAQELVCKAAEMYPKISFYSFQCSLANAWLAYERADPGALETAIDFQRNGLERDPYWYVHRANLASYEFQMGNYLRSQELMATAVESAPKRSLLWLNLGWIQERLDNLKSDPHYTDESLESYATAKCLYPWYRESIFFTRSVFRSRSLTKNCPIGFDMSSSNASWRHLWAGLRFIDEGDLSRAQESLSLAIQANPFDSIPYAYLANFYQRSGRDDLAWKLARTAVFIPTPSLRAWVLASLIAFEQGNEAQGMQYLAKAFGRMINPDYSQFFYEQAYHQEALPTDLSPYLIRAYLFPEMEQAFLLWEKYLLERGELEQYLKLTRWLERTREYEK